MVEVNQKLKKKNPRNNYKPKPIDIVLEALPCGCQKNNGRDLFIAKRGCHHFDKRLGKSRPSNHNSNSNSD